MYITSITNDYDNTTLSNCTFNENDIDMFVPTLLLTTPCGLSFFMFNKFDGVYINQTFIQK